MAEILPTGTNLSTIRSSGQYLVADPAGLPAGEYQLDVIEAANASGDNYCVHRLLNIGTGVEQIRAEEEGGFSSWVLTGPGPTGPTGATGPAGATGVTGPSGVGGGGGGGITETPVTTGGSPTSLDPNDGEVRFQITSGGTAGNETVTLENGEFAGQRVFVEFLTRTNAADRILFTMTNIRVISSLTVIGGTPLTFAEASLENPQLFDVGDCIALEWDSAVDFWFVRYLNPTPAAL
jgi:hypothetical protein